MRHAITTMILLVFLLKHLYGKHLYGKHLYRYGKHLYNVGNPPGPRAVKAGSRFLFRYVSFKNPCYLDDMLALGIHSHYATLLPEFRKIGSSPYLCSKSAA